MKIKHLLEKYLIDHPDYWEYEKEKAEVERLRNLVKSDTQLAHAC